MFSNSMDIRCGYCYFLNVCSVIGENIVCFFVYYFSCFRGDCVDCKEIGIYI